MKIKLIYYEIRKFVLIILSYLISPVFYFLIWRRKKSGTKNKQLKILIMPQLTRVGDLVCATPVFRAIKKQYPNCYLAVLVQGKIAGIIKNNPHIDKIIVFKSIDFVTRVLNEVRKERFDWSFCLSGAVVGTLVAFWGLIMNRVKLIREERPLIETLTDWMNSHKRLYKHHTYLPKFYLNLLEFINIYDQEEIKEVFTTPTADKKVNEFLKQMNINENDSLVGLSITAGNKIKEWGDEKFKELAKRIAEKYSAKIIFIGAKNDEQRIDAVLKDLDKKYFLKAVDFSLEELPSLMKRFRLHIGVDTGPIYIAHALKVPLIDIIGPVDPTEQPPEDEISILAKPSPYVPPSSFVFKKRGKSEEHKKALEATTVDNVLKEANRLI